MDHKAWPWKKKSMEKTVVESNGIYSNGEIEKLVADKIELENRLKSLNDKLTSVEAENNKHKTETQEAIAGWEKTKAEAVSLKKKLEEALNEKHRSDERTSHTDAGLKECMQQLRFVRDEQERRMHDALTKASHEHERRLMVIKTELADTSKKLAEAEGEKTQLSKALLAKSKTVEDLNRERERIQADVSGLVSSLESKEKENVSLRYEVRVVEKELELRNEEREFSRRTAEASHKLHLENVKKVAKLEQECQRLRVLVRKRLPGPAALSKMRSEVEMLGRGRVNGSSNSTMMINNNLTEQLFLLEEENKTLRDALNKKVNELQFSRSMYSRTASRLLEFEESSKGTTNVEPSRSSNVSHEVFSEFENDDKVSCSDSWASEVENVKKNKKQRGLSLVRTPKASEMKLMDDFSEMEKLASTLPPGSSPIFSSDSVSATGGPVENESNEDIKSNSTSKLHPSLHTVLKAIVEHKSVTQRSTDEVLEEIKEALSGVKQTETLAVEGGAPETECEISKSVRRIVEVIEGVSLKDERHVSGYTARVLQWKTTELSSVLQRFLQSCYDLIERKADMKKFAEELSCVVEWMVNHCFSLQDVSSMREEMKKQFEWDESRSGSEVDIGLLGQISEDNHKMVEEEAKEDKTASASENEPKLEEKQNMRTELEITAASEKLAECQETILNLGKQLKALTNSKETDNLTQMETKPEKRLTTQRSSLLDQMKAEDEDNGEESKKEEKKPQAADKMGKGGSSSVYSETIEALEHILLSDKKSKGSESNCFAVVPQKKSSGGGKSLWRKLLGRKKRSKTIKLPNPFAT
ncbi:Filament-like plant protein 7 [Raphanus sativus]|uniref:Filament-like plant protein 7 n=1 Tax=Raphanus sativus TaxID=3726 RepID=A0A6J0N766_RAPSA|nr:filament-like plant protein 7 [Raphanus sativus]XP_018480294.2 filament-like plant protein 7 [Raphanus sativus]KAJ4902834.1 Filament-like plant protein 7 [Raphanus sativus]